MSFDMQSSNFDSIGQMFSPYPLNAQQEPQSDPYCNMFFQKPFDHDAPDRMNNRDPSPPSCQSDSSGSYMSSANFNSNVFMKDHMPPQMITGMGASCEQSLEQPAVANPTPRYNTKTPDSSAQSLPVDAIRQLLNEQNIKKKRLARKAELARLSRRRKKVRLTDLEEENKNLRDEIDRLNDLRRRDQHLLRLTQTDRSLHEQVREMIKQGIEETPFSLYESSPERDSDPCPLTPETPLSLNCEEATSMTQSTLTLPASQAVTVKTESDIVKTKSEPVPAPAATGDLNDILIAIKAQIALAESNSVSKPDESKFSKQQLTFLQWMFSQPEEAYSDPEGLWLSLFGQELGCSPFQMSHLEASRNRMKAMIANTAEFEECLNTLKTLVHAKTADDWSRMQDLTTLFTPKQMSALSTWIQRFGSACMKMKM